MDLIKLIIILNVMQIGRGYYTAVDEWCFKCSCLPFLIICEHQLDVHFQTSITLSTERKILNYVNFTSEYNADRIIRQFPFINSITAIDSQLSCEFVNDFYDKSVNVTLINSCFYDKLWLTTKLNNPTTTDLSSSSEFDMLSTISDHHTLSTDKTSSTTLITKHTETTSSFSLPVVSSTTLINTPELTIKWVVSGFNLAYATRYGTFELTVSYIFVYKAIIDQYSVTLPVCCL